MSTHSMRAVGVVPGKKEVRILDHSAPDISAASHVRIRTLEVGICGTDREICSFVYGTPPHGFDYLILGHEGLGEVVEVGSPSSSFKVGDLVVPSVRRPCAEVSCLPCRNGRQDFCFTGKFTERGISHYHGFMTDYFVEDEVFLVPVPDELRDVAVLVEPLTIAEKGLAQLWATQQRLPWEHPGPPDQGRGQGRTAVVLGAGPVGILGAMAFQLNGFRTFVYSRSQKPNPKAAVVESFGVEYISSEKVSPDGLVKQIGEIDVVYEAIGVPSLSFEVLRVLGTNGVFVFTGIPAPKPQVLVSAHDIMRNMVLKNQAAVGTVNADGPAFTSAIRDLGEFNRRWPKALRSVITARHGIDAYRDLLLGKATGIKHVISFDGRNGL